MIVLQENVQDVIAHLITVEILLSHVILKFYTVWNIKNCIRKLVHFRRKHFCIQIWKYPTVVQVACTFEISANYFLVGFS